LCGSKE
jgi:hypothetical protein